MLEKITNRKYVKAVRKLEERLEFYKGKRDYYKAELRLGAQIYDAKEALEMFEHYDRCVDVMNMTLQTIKYI